MARGPVQVAPALFASGGQGLAPVVSDRAVTGARVQEAMSRREVRMVYTGFDVETWNPHIVWLWQHSNLSVIGFYVSTHRNWLKRWHDLRDLGWGLVPLYVPFQTATIRKMAKADGAAGGQDALKLAREAGIEKGAALYLDVEAHVFGDAFTKEQHEGFTRYISDWFRTVAGGGYAPGTYCSREDAARMVGATFRSYLPVLYPVSIHPNDKLTRAEWKDGQRGERSWLTPALPSTWDTWSDDTSWVTHPSAVGCQFDWFRDGRTHTGFFWRTARGGQEGFRTVDWQMSLVFDPAHPRAAVSIAAAGDRDRPDHAHIFPVRTTVIGYRERTATGDFTHGIDLRFGLADIGPRTIPELDAFDSASAAAVSRRSGCVDLFVIGQDRYVRTMWLNDRERFPTHPWALNPGWPARRSSPIAAVSRTLDQIDVFYVSEDHRLVTQWWNPGATLWSDNVRVLPGPLVAGGSNVAALGHPADSGRPSTLDVFYVSLNYERWHEPESGSRWSQGFQVVHAAWVDGPNADWRVAAIGGLEGAAAASGVAAARDGEGRIHVVVQRRDRKSLHHATLAPRDDWRVVRGPDVPPGRGDGANWWMTLHLVALPGALLLAGMTAARTLAWSVYRDGRWSAVSDGDVTFAASRPPAFVPRGAEAIDVIGVDEMGAVVTRVLRVTPTGRVTLVSDR